MDDCRPAIPGSGKADAISSQPPEDRHCENDGGRGKGHPVPVGIRGGAVQGFPGLFPGGGGRDRLTGQRIFFPIQVFRA